MTDYADDPDFTLLQANVRTELIPKLEGSAVVVSLVPDGDGDVKFALELGFSIMMDKPIIAVVRPGVTVPPKLIAVADRIVELDLTTPGSGEYVMRVVEETIRDYNL